jgi:alpha-ketoglutarate-dependent taurine dioxygenase
VLEIEDKGLLADKAKPNLFGAAKQVINLTEHIGTEIVGLQLSQVSRLSRSFLALYDPKLTAFFAFPFSSLQLTDDQKNELAVLIAERTVVFFRDQDLTPQAQRELGLYYGPIEVHPSAPQVPGLPGRSRFFVQHLLLEDLHLFSFHAGISIIWDKLSPDQNLGFRNPFGTQDWHTDVNISFLPFPIPSCSLHHW